MKQNVWVVTYENAYDECYVKCVTSTKQDALNAIKKFRKENPLYFWDCNEYQIESYPTLTYGWEGHVTLELLPTEMENVYFVKGFSKSYKPTEKENEEWHWTMATKTDSSHGVISCTLIVDFITNDIEDDKMFIQNDETLFDEWIIDKINGGGKIKLIDSRNKAN